MKSLLKFEKVTKKYKNGKIDEEICALSNVSFNLQKGVTTAVIGESGAGKSTLASLILKLQKPDVGKIYYKDCDIGKLDKMDLKNYRKKISILFQEPYLSFNPYKKLIQSLEEPLIINSTFKKEKKRQIIYNFLEQLKINLKDVVSKLPSEVSGGELQRIALIRAILLNPEFLILDEPFASIDKENKKIFMDFIHRLKINGMDLLFISHDMEVVKNFSEQCIVLNNGKIIEFCKTEDLNSSKNNFVKSLFNF